MVSTLAGIVFTSFINLQTLLPSTQILLTVRKQTEDSPCGKPSVSGGYSVWLSDLGGSFISLMAFATASKAVRITSTTSIFSDLAS